MNKRNNDVVYDANVDYDSLEQHIYEDAPGHIFYTCPKCGCDYLATFIVEQNGETMCTDCWNKQYGD